jgi:glucosylceramidase
MVTNNNANRCAPHGARIILNLAMSLAFVLPSARAAPAASVTWISSTDKQPWQTMPAPALAPASPDAAALVRAVPDRAYQTIDGFGGCFNELSWQALSKASPTDRERILTGLFGDDGCAFTEGRIPIGASDFATDAYSLDDTPDDHELKDFSTARDEKLLIPFVKEAIRVRPALKCWGSAWSPPAWMKTNNNYSKGEIRWEPRVLKSYATYLARWVETYRAAGIDVFAVFTQNEPNIQSNYPSCLWTGPHLREFVADYLGPTLRDRHTNVELWLGFNGDPINGGENINDRLLAVLQDPKASAFVTGVGFQYDSHNQIATASQLYPDKKLMESESECNDGKNSWAQAQKLYGLMKRYIDGGASSYFMWNMVLDETGMSTWKWRQNAMITVEQAGGRVTFNGEYYVMRHFSQFVKPGARRILTAGPWGDKIAFANPDGSIVFVIGNTSTKQQPIVISVAGRTDNDDTISVTLPGASVNTFVVPK